MLFWLITMTTKLFEIWNDNTKTAGVIWTKFGIIILVASLKKEITLALLLAVLMVGLNTFYFQIFHDNKYSHTIRNRIRKD